MMNMLLLFVLSLLMAGYSAGAMAISYTYDVLGRVKTVTDDSGATVEYVYDALGNILRINRLSSGTLGITGFFPTKGTAGTSVTIYGSGFSTTPGSNSVKLGEVPANVISATSNTLLIAIPSGAATGKFSAVVGGATATSREDFVVAATNGLPAINGFSPAVGGIGTLVTITGTNFDPAATRVELNARIAKINSITPTQITFTVPVSVTSGKIRVITGVGMATSAADFVVPPLTYSASDIGGVFRLELNKATDGVANPSDKVGLLLVDANGGELFSIDFPVFSITPSNGSLSLRVIRPDNTEMLNIPDSSISSNRRSFHLPQLPMSGTYTVLIPPGATYSLTAKLLAAQPISVDGATNKAPIEYSGRSVRYWFNASAGQNLGLGSTGAITVPANGYQTAKVFLPDSTVLASGNTGASYWDIGANMRALPVSGMYTLVSGLQPNYTGTVDLTLSTEVTRFLSEGIGANLNIGRRGQNALLSFSGVAGQYLSISAVGITTNPIKVNSQFTVYRPEGGVLLSQNVPYYGGTIHMPTLPASGTYTVFVDPEQAAAWSGSLKSFTPKALAVDGPSAIATITAEEPVYTFDAAAGQNLGMGFTQVSGTPSIYARISVYQPNGVELPSAGLSTAGDGALNLINLPQTGRYSVRLATNPNYSVNGSLTLSTDVAKVLNIGEAAQIAITRPGQNGRYTFSGGMGQYLSVVVMGVTTSPIKENATISIYRPNGALLKEGVLSYSGGTLHLPPLPEAGTYTLLLDPDHGATWSATLRLAEPKELAIDGASTEASASAGGEELVFKFSGLAGQNLGLGLTQLTGTPTTYASITVYKPDGTNLPSGTFSTASDGSMNLFYLPQSGIYTLRIRTHQNNTLRATLTLSSDVLGVLTVGSSISVATARYGQNLRYKFSGTSGQMLRLNLSAIATQPAGSNIAVQILKPDGTALHSATGAAAFGVDIPSLPTSGDYTVFIEPIMLNGSSSAATVTMTLLLQQR